MRLSQKRRKGQAGHQKRSISTQSITNGRRNGNKLFIKELFKAAGFELNVHNLIADYTLPDGRRMHNAFQVLGNQVEMDDNTLIEQAKTQIPKGSRICIITEIKGDFELPELSRLAESFGLLLAEKRIIYLDRELAQEYIDEIKRGKLR